MRVIAFLVLLAGCIATRPPKLDERPRWRVAGDAPLDAGCVLGRAFVRKSGKQGFGVALQLRSREDCAVIIDYLELVFPHRTLALDVVDRREHVLPGRSQRYAWLPVAFDNNAMWNAGHDTATLVLALRVAGQRVAWRIPVVQR